MIRVAKTNEIVDALKLAFGDLDQTAITNRLTQSLIEYEKNPNLFDGMIVDVNNGMVQGVIWCVKMPGNTSVTGLPRHVEGTASGRISSLLNAANVWLEDAGLSLNQFVLEPAEASIWAPILAAHQHPLAIELDDMVLKLSREDSPEVEQPIVPENVPTSEFRSRPVDPVDLPTLQLLIELTFQESQDCPELAGHLLPSDTLNGYRNTGDTDIEFWRILESGKRLVGCLLLGLRPGLEQAEIVYVGVQPDSRRKGVGSHAMQLASELAKQQHLSEVVAAVDRRNTPAIRMYESMGFKRRLSRFAIVRLLDNRQVTK